MIVAGTGHRMEKLGGYNSTTERKVLTVARQAIAELKPSKVISGMALGWDQALALTALENSIPLICAVPLKGFQRKWPMSSQHAFTDILACADEVVYVDELHGYALRGYAPGVYHPAKMNIRNRWMVDNSQMIAALWDGSRGGTGNCMEIVQQLRRESRNFWRDFVALK